MINGNNRTTDTQGAGMKSKISAPSQRSLLAGVSRVLEANGLSPKKAKASARAVIEFYDKLYKGLAKQKRVKKKKLP